MYVLGKFSSVIQNTFLMPSRIAALRIPEKISVIGKKGRALNAER